MSTTIIVSVLISLCGFTLLGGFVLLLVLLARQSSAKSREPRPVRRAEPVERSHSAVWVVGLFMLLLLGLVGAGGVLFLVSDGPMPPFERGPTPGWAVVVLGGLVVVAVLCFLGFRALARGPRREPPPPAGPGYTPVVVAWGVGISLLVVMFTTGLVLDRTNRKLAGLSADAWAETFFPGAPVIVLGLLLITAIQFARVKASRRSRREPVEPTGPGYKLLVAAWVVGFLGVSAINVMRVLFITPHARSSELVLGTIGGYMMVTVLVGIPTVVRYLWINRNRLSESIRYAAPPRAIPAIPILPTPAPSPPPPSRACPKCGAAVAADAAQGLCPRCLLGAMMPVPEQLSLTIAHGPFVPPTVEEVAEFFPQFEVLRIAGQGGMGAVYLARQKALDRMVALKLIRTAREDDPTFVERFAREARAMAKLSHPNIVAVHDTGEAGGLPYLVMEYVDGVTLRDAIRTKSITPAQALLIIPQICDALEYAHKQGVVHRDIKPENILLDAAGHVKIADFGLAKLADPNAMSLTGTLQAMGTPHYMAPEQWEKPSEVDHRADIYALGVVLYELLTGELPLGRFDPPSVKSRVDARIDELVLRALAKEPDRRYQHATDVKLALAHIAATPGWVARPGFREYKSKATLLGWPLVHVVSGRDPVTGLGKTAKGWLAVGNNNAVGLVAVGGVSAYGGIAVAGAFSVGVIAMAGGAAAGLFALGGGFALAVLAAGAGGVAASGGLAVAGGYAIGQFAIGASAAGNSVISSTHQDADFRARLIDSWNEFWHPVVLLFRDPGEAH